MMHLGIQVADLGDAVADAVALGAYPHGGLRSGIEVGLRGVAAVPFAA